MSAIKTLVTALLAPAARVANATEGLRRAWAHARVSARLGRPVDSSAVFVGMPEIHGTANITLGRDLYLYRELYWETQEHGAIAIGDGVVMSRGVHVVSFASIEIGRGAMIGEYASIRDANHVIDGEGPLRHSGHEAKPIVVGEDAWIGRGVTVLGGVTIGARAVVGANAVVTKSIPEGAIAVGVPARVIASRAAPAPVSSASPPAAAEKEEACLTPR